MSHGLFSHAARLRQMNTMVGTQDKVTRMTLKFFK
jgi:hypothetical protein